MSDEKYKSYIIETIKLLKEQAVKAKKDAENPKDDFAQGQIMGYYAIINLLKHQAFTFCIDQKELGLADIKPDIDLLGLTRNPNIECLEDNWAIDDMAEELVKGYLRDTIWLLKDWEIVAKKDAENPEEGSEDFTKGELMAYHKVFSTMKNQASLFGIDQEEVHLSAICSKYDG